MAKETFLRSWAILAMLLIATVYALQPIFESAIVRPETNIVVRSTVAGLLLIVILGFFLRMFFECALANDVYRRGGWLLLFIVVPIFSAFVYFFVTRSAAYKAYVQRVETLRGGR